MCKNTTYTETIAGATYEICSVKECCSTNANHEDTHSPESNLFHNLVSLKRAIKEDDVEKVSLILSLNTIMETLSDPYPFDRYMLDRETVWSIQSENDNVKNDNVKNGNVENDSADSSSNQKQS